MRLTALATVGALALTLGACSAGVETEDQGASGSELQAASCTTTTLKGVDVSWHNGTVNWTKVKSSGRTFAFARVSDGVTQVDTEFVNNWPGMKRAGLVRGVYQFFRARHDGPEQADVLLNELAKNGGLKKGDLPPVLDLETADGQSSDDVIERAQRWLDKVEAVIGQKPIVYTGNQMNGIIEDAFKDYPLWIAHYETDCPRVPDAWNHWHFWQNAEDATVSGVGSGNVDTNFFNGTKAKLDALTLTHDVVLPNSQFAAAD